MTAREGPDPAVARLLRWYPRAWRQRYGDEFLAMVEDILDGGAPTLRLHLSVAWAGLRERGHQVGRTGNAKVKGLNAKVAGLSASGDAVTWWLKGPIVAGIFASLPLNLRAPPPAARGWQTTGALDTEIGFAALGGVAILASAVLVVPAFGRFLWAGGWPRIHRRIGWAAAATVAAGGALAGIILASTAETFDQLESWNYFLGIAVTWLLLALALRLLTRAATSTARQLGLPHRVRAAEKVLVAVGAAAVSIVIVASYCYNAATRPAAPMFLLGIAAAPVLAYNTTSNLRGAVRESRRLWSAPDRG